MEKISTILFDFDGTLADTKELVLNIYNRLAPRFKSRPLPREKVDLFSRKKLNILAGELGLPEYKLPAVAAAVKKEMKKEISHIPLFPGIPSLLEELKSRGLKLGILSSNNRKNIKAFLLFNHLNYFEYLHSQKDLFGKAHTLLKFLKVHKLEKEELLYVGDETRDIEACHKAGIAIAAVSWGYNHPEALKAARPDMVLEEPAELLKNL